MLTIKSNLLIYNKIISILLFLSTCFPSFPCFSSFFYNTSSLYNKKYMKRSFFLTRELFIEHSNKECLGWEKFSLKYRVEAEGSPNNLVQPWCWPLEGDSQLKENCFFFFFNWAMEAKFFIDRIPGVQKFHREMLSLSSTS